MDHDLVHDITMPKRKHDAALPTEAGIHALATLAALCAAPAKGGEYEEVPLEGGGYKRRRVGAKQWQRYCEHGTRKQRCKECGGSALCEHGRERTQCKECGGSVICEHGRRRSTCKECGGLGTCEHGCQRRQCKECGGSSARKHGRVRK